MAINKLMSKGLRLTPIVCAALGAAVSYYIFSSVSFGETAAYIIVFLFVLTGILCFISVLASVPEIFKGVKPRAWQLTKGSANTNRSYLIILKLSACLAAGFAIGVSAAAAGNRTPNFTLPQSNIIAIEGILLDDPRIIGGGRAMVNLSLQRCAADGGVRASGRGEITVFFTEENAERLRQFGRGASVFSEGRLNETKAGFVFSADSMHIVNAPPPIERIRTRARLSLINRFEKLSGNSNELSGEGGLALALLLGIRDNLDSDLASAYRRAGSSYILALSGMHLAVLAAIIAFLLRKPLGLKGAAIAGAVLICLYCFLVGPMPSLNRAALMYLLGTIAILFVFPKEPLAVLALSFLIQLVITPAAGNSLSFILSYLALAGILIASKPIYSLLAGLIPDVFLQPLSASCGAFLATAGVCAFSFGYIAPVGIIAGLLLVPLTTIYMIGSLLWLLLDFVSFSAILSMPLSLLYKLMETIVTGAGKVPGISGLPPFVILIFSIVIIAAVIVFDHRCRKKMFLLKQFN